MIDKTIYPYAYLCPFCNRQIFFFKEKPQRGEHVLAREIYFENGTQPNPGDPIVCPNSKCGAKLSLFTRFVVETKDIQV